MLKFTPAVFAVNDSYQIMVRVNAPCVMWVRVGDRNFYDDSNGILRSNTTIHRMTLPVSLLDKEKKYTVCYRAMPERKPYFTEPLELVETEYSFRPLPHGKFRAYHISDAHNMVEAPVAAANTFGDIDLLILNGDVPNHSGNVKYFDGIYDIVERLTHGNIPVIFSRGNHDMRGVSAEELEKYTPTDLGRSYFTVRLGSLWCIVLDCGEDKCDDSVEYGGTICCHDFRLRETEFIKEVIKSEAFNSDGITHRLIISHHPFACLPKAPFNIEEDLYREWLTLLSPVRPDLHLAGHLHGTVFSEKGSELDSLGQLCTTVIGARPDGANNYFVGAGFEFTENCITVSFTDSKGETLETHKIIKELH